MRSLMILSFIFVFCQDAFSRSIPDKQFTDSLVPFYLIFRSGDEVVRTYELKVYKENNRCYARNSIEPEFYVGGKVDSNWTVELDSNKIKTCIKFINKARTLPKKCQELTSSITEYQIVFGNDTIKITGDCKWDSLDFFSLRDVLFKERFSELELKRLALVERLNKQLQGKWYFIPFKKEPLKMDSLILSRKNNFFSDCFWEFGIDNSFKSSCNSILDSFSCNKIFDLTYSNKYEWSEEEIILLEVQPGMITESNGNMTFGNDGATFMLDTLNDSNLKLLFMGR